MILAIYSSLFNEHLELYAPVLQCYQFTTIGKQK